MKLPEAIASALGFSFFSPKTPALEPQQTLFFLFSEGCG